MPYKSLFLLVFCIGITLQDAHGAASRRRLAFREPTTASLPQAIVARVEQKSDLMKALIAGKCRTFCTILEDDATAEDVNEDNLLATAALCTFIFSIFSQEYTNAELIFGMLLSNEFLDVNKTNHHGQTVLDEINIFVDCDHEDFCMQATKITQLLRNKGARTAGELEDLSL